MTRDALRSPAALNAALLQAVVDGEGMAPVSAAAPISSMTTEGEG